MELLSWGKDVGLPVHRFGTSSLARADVVTALEVLEQLALGRRRGRGDRLLVRWELHPPTGADRITLAADL
ncbi:MAG: hypothetical protein U0166_26275 [Acidobacteriota bacterium]